MSFKMKVDFANGSSTTFELPLDAIGATFDGLRHATTRRIVNEYAADLTTTVFNSATTTGFGTKDVSDLPATGQRGSKRSAAEALLDNSDSETTSNSTSAPSPTRNPLRLGGGMLGQGQRILSKGPLPTTQVALVDHPKSSIFVRETSGKVFAYKVGAGNVVCQLKDLIFSCRGIPPDQQRLIYAGRQLEDHLSMRAYNVTMWSVIHLVLRLRGL